MTNSNLSHNQWIVGLLVTSLLAVVILTLAPFNFSFEPGGKPFFLENISNFRHRSSMDDWVANLLLYVPLGFSLSAWLQTQKVGKLTQFVWVLLVSFSLSTAIEFLQLSLPSRVSSSTDIYANTVGGIIGMQLDRYLGHVFIVSTLTSVLQKQIRKVIHLPIQNISLILAGYLLIVFLISVSLQSVINLSNWSTVYPLLIGNDQAAGEPWHGAIANLAIADRAISQTEVAQAFAGEEVNSSMSKSVVTAYSFEPHHNRYPDKAGHSPDLVWQGESMLQKGETVSRLNADRWLETETPASLINQRLKQSSQFTLSAILATDNIEQTGAISIISLSNQSTDRRNFALAQDGENLIIWLRTSVTGDKGARPELIVPHVFSDTELHHLIITYAHSIVRFYIDDLENQFSFELNPGIVLFRKGIPIEELGNASLNVCNILYYSCLFVPLGIFIGLIFILTKRGMTYRVVLVIEGALLLPLMLELLLTVKNSRDFSLASLLLSWAVITMTIAATCILTYSSFDRRSSQIV
jgi:glycopeptide antibiotics resistance protein